jgi:hypothetical protein
MAFAVETVSLFKSQKSHWHKKNIHNTYTERERGGGERERARGMESQSSNKATRQAKERKRQKVNPEKEMIVQ